ILKRWASANQVVSPATAGSMTSSCLTPPPASVRAHSAPPPFVLKNAHGVDSNVLPKPTCWKPSPENCAVAAMVRTPPAGTVAKRLVSTRAPSTVNVPLATTAWPPPTVPHDELHRQLVQPTGRLEPLKPL